MNVAVVGSRAFRDYCFLCEKLDALRFLWGDFTVVSGGAQGADSLAVRWAKERGLPEPIIIPAAWDDLSRPDAVIKTRRDGKRYDARAGFRRNQQIIDNCDVVVAFWDGMSPGTKDAIKRARQVEKFVYLLAFQLGARDTVFKNRIWSMDSGLLE